MAQICCYPRIRGPQSAAVYTHKHEHCNPLDFRIRVTVNTREFYKETENAAVFHLYISLNIVITRGARTHGSPLKEERAGELI